MFFVILFLLLPCDAYALGLSGITNSAVMAASMADSNVSRHHSYYDDKRRNAEDMLYGYNDVVCDDDGNQINFTSAPTVVISSSDYGQEVCASFFEQLCGGKKIKFVNGQQITQTQFVAARHFISIKYGDMTAAKVNEICKQSKRILK